jgi:hypothetical protein
MNEKYFDEIVQATLDELRAMSHSELRAEIEKRKKSDFARIFSETGEVSDDFSPPIQQIEKFLPRVVEKVLLRVEPYLK